MSDKEIIEAPDGWIVDRYEFTGNSKLVARFVSPHKGDEIHIVPYKTYGIPELVSSHRITLTEGDTVQLIAEGREVETPEEAEKVAKDLMASI
jgi:hypothetical protein